jgi:hypothetical protein
MNHFYVNLYWFKRIAIIFEQVQIFQVAQLPETEYLMTKFLEHNVVVWSMIGC